MPTFAYSALKPDGSLAKGELTANDRAEAMRRRADAMDADAVQAEIALRLLHRNLLDTRDDDDMEAVEFLLSQVL